MSRSGNGQSTKAGTTMASLSTTGDRIESTLRFVGDLDHPFYDDERQRFVWYEASAIGLQLVLITSYGTAGVLMLVGGAAAVPYAFASLTPILVTLLFVVWYCQRKNAPFFATGSDFKRRRVWLVLAMTSVLIAGIIRALLDISGDASSGFSGGLAKGALVGVFVGGIAAGLKIAKDAKSTEAAVDER